MLDNFANEFDALARGAIAHVAEITENLKKAETEKSIRQKPDESSVAYRARLAAADAKLEAAQEAHRKMRLNYPGEVATKIEGMRAELEKAVSDRFAARPADIDHDVLTLLDSGILTATEFVRLYNEASSPTMKRLIGHAAGEAAERMKDDREASRILRNVANAGTQFSGSQYLAAFDGLTDVLRRTMKNPAMSKFYAELTDPYLEVLRH